MLSTEPKLISILRQRLRKSGSKLEFDVDKITDSMLETVVKYLPETKGTYKVTKPNTHLADVSIIERDEQSIHLELEILNDDGIQFHREYSNKKRKHYSYTTGPDYYYWNLVHIEDENQQYMFDKNELMIGIVRKTSEYEYQIYLNGEIEMKCYQNNVHTLDKLHASAKFDSSLVRTHMSKIARFDYVQPIGEHSFETGPIMHYKYIPDFTNKKVINAILQLKPKNDCEYIIYYVDYPEFVVREINNNDAADLLMREVMFGDNKIIAEEIFQKNAQSPSYIKKITEKGCEISTYICQHNLIYQHYNLDKLNKLCSIRVKPLGEIVGPEYDIQIVDYNNIKVHIVRGEVYADDIAYAFGGPLPYKFEYLV
jgi:hypothetical protein